MKRDVTLHEVKAMPTPRKYNTEAERSAAYRERQKETRLRELQAKGLPPLPPIPTMPGKKRWLELLKLAVWGLTTIRDEMQTYSDDRSASWHEGENAAALQERLDTIETILEQMTDWED